MRRVKGSKALMEYLESIGCPLGKTTVFRLLKENRIPAIRPSEKILIFDLDAIDKWLTGEEITS